MKVYLYKDIEYKTERAVRKAIFESSRIAFPNITNDNEWKYYGVEVIEVTVPSPTEEELAKQVRAKRDSLLRKSDFYMLSDYPSTEGGLERVKAYRQALRDISDDIGFPGNVTWPTEPEELK